MMAPIVITQANVPPPNYEEATKMPDFKPPEYRVVVESNPASGNGSNADECGQTGNIPQSQVKNSA